MNRKFIKSILEIGCVATVAGGVLLACVCVLLLLFPKQLLMTLRGVLIGAVIVGGAWLLGIGTASAVCMCRIAVEQSGT